MDKPIHRTPLTQETAHALNRLGIIKCGQLLQRSELSLSFALDLSVPDVRRIIDTVAKAIISRCDSAWDILVHKKNAPAFLPTGLYPLDETLYGGIPAGTITELVGRAGVGKTQMCLTLTALATLPPTNVATSTSSVVYIDTEQKFDPNRLLQIIMSRCKVRQMEQTDTAFRNLSSQELRRVCTNAVARVSVFTLTTCKELVDRLRKLQRLVIEKNVKLLIVDSVAAVARQEYSSIVHRQAWLNQQASLLKYIAERFEIPVVVTNQVTTRVGADASDALLPALGNTWSHCVNTRLVLHAENRDRCEIDQVAAVDRSLTVQKSPMADQLVLNYEISERGVTTMVKKGGQ